MFKPLAMFRFFRRKKKPRFKPEHLIKTAAKTPPPVKIVKRRAFWRGRMAIIFGISAAGGFAGWGAHEIKYQFSNKAKAVEALVERSKQCNDDMDAAYRARLRSLLRGSHSEAVDALYMGYVTPCLSRALAEKTERLMGAFYAQQRVLVLRDDGTPNSIWKRLRQPYANGQVSDVIDTLPGAWKDFKTEYEILYASAFGQPTPHRVDWWHEVKNKQQVMPRHGPPIATGRIAR